MLFPACSISWATCWYMPKIYQVTGKQSSNQKFSGDIIQFPLSLHQRQGLHFLLAKLLDCQINFFITALGKFLVPEVLHFFIQHCFFPRFCFLFVFGALPYSWVSWVMCCANVSVNNCGSILHIQLFPNVEGVLILALATPVSK